MPTVAFPSTLLLLGTWVNKALLICLLDFRSSETVKA